MSDYSRSIDFTAKDALASGNPNKIVKGADIDSELDTIAGASATKSNKIAPAASGNIAALSSTGDLLDSGITATELAILDGATVTTAELNILDGATLTTTELNYVDGVTSDIQTQIDSKITSPATDTHITKTIGSEGTQAVSASSSWVPPAGFYNLVIDLFLFVEIYVGGSWRASGGATGTSPGFLWCDGTNMRITNSDSSSHNVYWQKLT